MAEKPVPEVEVEDLYEHFGRDPNAPIVEDLYEHFSAQGDENEIEDLYEHFGVKTGQGTTWGEVGESLAKSVNPGIGETVRAMQQRSAELDMEESRRILADPEAEARRRVEDMPQHGRFTVPRQRGDEYYQQRGIALRGEHEQRLKEVERDARRAELFRHREADRLQALRPDFSPEDWGKEMIYDTGMAGIKMAPALAVGVATKGVGLPGAVAATLGTGTFMATVRGDAYGHARDEKKSIEQAAYDSSVTALIEGGTEALVFGRLWSMGGPVIRKVLDVTVGEGASEAVSNLLQQAYDKGLVTGNMSLAEALEAVDWGDVLYEGGIGTLLGLALGGGSVPFDIAAEKRAIKRIKTIVENSRFENLSDGAVNALIENGDRLAKFHKDTELGQYVDVLKAERQVRAEERAREEVNTDLDVEADVLLGAEDGDVVVNKPPVGDQQEGLGITYEAQVQGATEYATPIRPATVGAAAEQLKTEPQETIEAQIKAFVDGRKPAVLFRPGQTPTEIPEGAQLLQIKGEGTLMYWDGDTETVDAALSGELGTALGYGIPNKPEGATDVVTARDQDGVVVQDVVTDGRPEAEEAASIAAGPGGTVETRPVTDSIKERLEGGAAGFAEVSDEDLDAMMDEALGGVPKTNKEITAIAEDETAIAAADQALIRSQKAKDREARKKKVKTEDSLGAVIAKMGGISRAEMEENGFDYADIRGVRSGLSLAFHNGERAESLDGMRELVNGMGFQFDSLNDFIDAITEEVRGNKQYTPAGYEFHMEQSLQDQEEARPEDLWRPNDELDPNGRPLPPLPEFVDGAYQEETEGEVYNSNWSNEARNLHDLYIEALRLAPEQTEELWESGRSDGEMAAALYQLIQEKINDNQQKGEKGDQGERGGVPADGQVAAPETFAAEEGQEADLLGDNTDEAQAVADAIRDKDDKRNQQDKDEPALVQSDDELFADNGRLPPDLFDDQPAPKKPPKKASPAAADIANVSDEEMDALLEGEPTEKAPVTKEPTAENISEIAPVGSYVLYQNDFHRGYKEYSGIVYMVDKVLDGYMELKDIRDPGRGSVHNSIIRPDEIRNGVLIERDGEADSEDIWLTPVTGKDAAAFIERDRADAAETKAENERTREKLKSRFIPKQVKKLDKVSTLKELLWHIGAPMSGTQAELFRRYKDMARVVADNQDVTAQELNAKSSKQLEELSRQLGLPVSGNKRLKANRILERMQLVKSRVGKTRGDVLNDPEQLAQKLEWVKTKRGVMRLDVGSDIYNETEKKWISDSIDLLGELGQKLESGQGEQADLEAINTRVKDYNKIRNDALDRKAGQARSDNESRGQALREWHDDLNKVVEETADKDLPALHARIVELAGRESAEEGERIKGILDKHRDAGDMTKYRYHLAAFHRLARAREIPEAAKSEWQKKNERESASAAIAAAAEHGVKGVSEALKGLDKLFGGKGKLSSGPTFDEETYAQAKPHFKAALEEFVAAGRSLADFIKFIVDQWGDAARPYLRQFHRDVRASKIKVKGVNDAADTGTDQAGDRTDAGDQAPVDEAPVRNDGRGTGEAGEQTGAPIASAGIPGQGNLGLPGIEPAIPGEPSDTSVSSPDGRHLTDGDAAGSDDAGGTAGDGAGGVQSDTQGSEKATRSGFSYHASISDKRKAQIEANEIPNIQGDLNNIRETLPFLLPEQQEDVLFAENRWIAGGTGVMFTNGTGTGKTYTGLGIVRRHINQTGSTDVLILVPSDTKAKDWIEDGRNLGIEITQLRNKRDKGTGVVITTYANFLDNWELHDRNFTMIMPDESHKITQAEKEKSSTYRAFRAAASHKDGLFDKAYFRNPDARELEYGRRRFVADNERLLEQIRANPDGGWTEEQQAFYATYRSGKKKDNREQWSDNWEEQNRLEYARVSREARDLSETDEFQALVGTNKVVFLSATPFAYHPSLDYAEGYLFDFPPENQETVGGWSHISPRDQFFITNFGYQWKNGRLNKPAPEVDVGLMERNFTENLKHSGSLRARMLEVDYDYSREFVLFDSELGQKVDQGINVLRGLSPDGERLSPDEMREAGYPVFQILPEVINKKFNYIYLAQLREAILSGNLVPRIQAHLDLNRKVIVFHDYQQWNGGHPFDLSGLEPPSVWDEAQQIALMQQLEAEIAAFNARYPEFRELPLNDLGNVVGTLQEAFGEDVAVRFDGKVTNRQRVQARNQFNQDHSNAAIIVVQRQSGREGISLHDVSGVHQRALVDMGLPTAPVDSIQTEGRAYRVGVLSDAIFEYPVLQTGFEQYMFATRIAERARTAENLAMGNLARTLDMSFREGYIEAWDFPPNDNQGTGGKERDRAREEQSRFEIAKTLYYARGRRSGRRDQREGFEYFSTPEPLGLKMVEWANMRPNERALEPSAGHGAIARWFPDETRNLFIEPSTKLANEVQLLSNGAAETKRFEDIPTGSKFNAIVMNPPFGQGGSMAFDHLEKAMMHLTNGGRIVALVPTGPAADKRFNKLFYGKDNELEELKEKVKRGTIKPREYEQRRRQLQDFHLMADLKLPRVVFERAGTQVATRILVIDRYSNPADVPNNSMPRDLSSYEDIKDFFDDIENMSVPGRGTISQNAPAPVNDLDVVQAGGVTAIKESAFHAVNNEEIWRVRLDGRVDRASFSELKKAASRVETGRYGYYSGFARGGAKPGFVFSTEDAAGQFLNEFANILEPGAVEERADAYHVEEYGEKGYSGLKKDTKEHVDHALAQTEHPEATKALLDKYKGTPWAKQAIAGARVRAALSELLQGKEPTVDSVFNTERSTKLKNAIKRKGEAAIWSFLGSHGTLSHPSKPINSVNGSFLNCEPSKNCAEFCYAASGRNYASIIIRAELSDWAVRNNPQRFAKMVADDYKSTPEYAAGRALRLFERGDGHGPWVEFIKALNLAGITTHVFSKRPEFLRKVPQVNVRLLSVDQSNQAMAEENKDLPIAYALENETESKWLGKHRLSGGTVQVILPISTGRGANKVPTADMGKMPKWTKPVTCPIDKGSVKIGKGAGEWNCANCDNGMGVGCYNKNTTKQRMREFSLPLSEIGRQSNFEDTIDEIRSTARTLEPGRARRFHAQLDRLLHETRAGLDPETENPSAESVSRETEADAEGGAGIDRDGGVVKEPEGTLYEPTDEEVSQDPAAAAAKSVSSLRRPELRGGGTILANQIARDFKEESKVNFIGQKVRSHQDLATLAQVYRNPSFETFRMFFLKDGVIVGQTAVTSRLPGTSDIYAQKGKDWTYDIGIQEIQDQMDAVEADAFYVLHNHPSGDPSASGADLRVTKQLVKDYKQLLLGHVIIDHDTYNFINREGVGVIRNLPAKAMEERDTYTVGDPVISHPLLGARITTPEALAMIAYDLKTTSNYLQLIGTNRNGVTGIMEVPVTSMTRDSLRLLAQVRAFMRQTGSVSVFAVNVPIDTLAKHKEKWKKAIETDVLTDVMAPNGFSLLEKGIGIPRGGYESGRRGNKAYTVREDADVVERTNAFWHAIKDGQPIDAPFRLLFQAFGSIDSRGEWHAPKGVRYTKERAVSLLDKAAEKTYEHLPWAEEMIETAKAGLIDRYKLDEEYKARDAERQAHEYEIALKGVKIVEDLQRRNMNAAEAKVLQAILTENAYVPDEDWQALSDDIRAAVDEMGKEAADLGLISRETWEKNRATYLHRVYMRHEAHQSGPGKFMQQFLAGRRKNIIGNTFRGRGLFKEVTQERLLKDVPPDWFGSRQEQGEADKQLKGKEFIIFDLPQNVGQGVGELLEERGGRRARIKQRVYWPADVDVPARYNGWDNQGTFVVRGTKRGKLVLWRDFTKAERLKMGEIVDARYTIAKTFQLLAKDLSSGRFLADIATNQTWTWQESDPPDPASVADARERSYRTYVGKEWVRVPLTMVEGTGVHRWGALAGKYVRPEIWRDLNELDRMQNPKTWRKILTQWKLNKTARNPVVHTNNIMSNMLLMDMADVRFQDLGSAIKAMRAKDDLYNEALQHGAFGGSFILNEIGDEILQPLLDELMQQNMDDRGFFERKVGQMGRMMDVIGKYAVKFDRGMRSVYQFEDNLFRMATYIRRRAQGDSIQEAARMAREQFLNYDIRAPWINLLRNSVLPFLSYTYRAVPVIADSIARRPWKLMKYATVVYGMQWMIQEMLGLSDDEADRERRSLRDEEQGNVWLPGVPRMFRMPWNDEHDNPVFLDIRRWIPAGDVFDVNQGQVPWLVAPLQLGGPLALGFELHLNKTAFTGKEIWNNKTDDALDIVSKTADWAYKSWMPSAPWIPNSWYWTKIGNAATGALNFRGQPLSLGYSASSSVGIKLRQHDVDAGFTWKDRDYNAILRDLQLQHRIISDQHGRGIISDADYARGVADLNEKVEDVQKRARKTFKGE